MLCDVDIYYASLRILLGNIGSYLKSGLAWLRLELMPFGRASVGWVMTPSWGEGDLKAGARDMAPPRQPHQYIYIYIY